MSGTARERYELLKTQRLPFLDRGRECAKLTIPAMLPPDGHSGYAKLPTPWQALGARCVNNTAAKLLLSLFPPSATFFKLTVDDYALERLTRQQGMRGEVEKALNKIERAVCAEIETGAMRPALFEILKHLVATGNVLLFVPEDGPLRVYRLDRYVVKRDPMGSVLEIVTWEKISPLEVPKEAQGLIENLPKPTGKKATDDYIDLYTHIRRTQGGWRIHQELNDQVVPGSRGVYPKAKLPWHALRLTAIDNEDYGRGLVEEYLGDFKSLEALTKAITQGAAAAAKVLFLVKNNGTTKPRVIAQAESGDVATGNAEDVTVLQVEKYADFKVALELRNSLKQDLSLAFLLNTAVQRAGERVTAEEIRFMAQELETGYGGIYSNLSQELQLPLVSLLMDRKQKKGELPPLPRKYIKPAITTGLDAIGRGNDRTRLSQFLQDLAVVDAKPGGIVERNINEPELVKRMGVGNGIDMDGLVKTQEQIDADAKQKQMQQMVETLGPNAINAMAKSAPAKPQ
jgi:hypothetical protein